MIERGAGWEMHLGDCLQVMPTLAPVEHVITDPPYEAEAHTLQRRKAAGWRHHKMGAKIVDAPLDFAPLTTEVRHRAAEQMSRLAKRWVLAFCQAEAVSAWRLAYEEAGLVWKRSCIWIKPDGQPQMSGDRPGMGYESIACAHAPGRTRWNGGGRHGIFRHPKNEDGALVGVKNEHPTQKPKALMIELVSLFTDPGETVLDAFAGSGTTGIACLRLGRHFVGIERDPTYFALACERLRAEESGSTLQASRAGQLPLLGGVK